MWRTVSLLPNITSSCKCNCKGKLYFACFVNIYIKSYIFVVLPNTMCVVLWKQNFLFTFFVVKSHPTIFLYSFGCSSLQALHQPYKTSLEKSCISHIFLPNIQIFWYNISIYTTYTIYSLIFRHASDVSSTYPGQSVRESVTLSDFLSVSVSETSKSIKMSLWWLTWRPT